MSTRVVVSRRFRGPGESANGGYFCGRLAAITGEVMDISLRRPIPLEAEIEASSEADRINAFVGDALVAEGHPTHLDVEVPSPVPSEEVVKAQQKHLAAYVSQQPFPNCFVCGSERREGDGMRIFAVPACNRDVFVARWTPSPDLADRDGRIPEEFVWAALDCPSAGPVGGYLGKDDLRLVRHAVAQRGALPCDRSYLILTWALKSDGRKRTAGSALLDDGGEPLAIGRSLWLEVLV